MPTPNLPQSPNELCNACHLLHPNRRPSHSLAVDADTTADLSHSSQHYSRGPQGTSVALIDPSASRPQSLFSAAGSRLRLRGGGLDTSDSPESSSAGTVVRIGENESQQHITESSPGARRKGKAVSIAQNSPEIMGDQQPLEEYRLKLARDIERRELSSRSPPSRNSHKIGVSPVQEEASLSPTSSSDVQTGSTESNKTVRGGMTPGFVARTPSYPFPRMGTPGFQPGHFQNAFSQQHFGNLVLHEQLRSDPSTPASAMTFLPSGATPYSGDCDYPAPNLYDLSLMLSAEPGVNAWWNTVIQIMTDCYKAERVTLSVPADSTDIDNVPWGQKATYNAQEEDEMSVGYIARGSSLMTNSGDGLSEYSSNVDLTQKSEKPVRPGIQSRHSFTTYEDKKESRKVYPGESHGTQRPGSLSRSKSYYPGAGRRDPISPHPLLNQQTLEQHDSFEDQQPVPNWEAKLESNSEVKGRVHPVLQGLDLEADPLIDHNSITRVIERGKVVALTRSYPYLDTDVEEKNNPARHPGHTSSQDFKQHRRTQTRSESGSKLSSLLANASTPLSFGQKKKTPSGDKTKIPSLLSAINDAPPRPPTPKYEEYEQAPPSPWSQSPAPSPAVRPDPLENPFFTDAVVDEESFNPGPSPHDYSSAQPPETIGVDNSWTVLHIPLNHILHTKLTQRFKLDPAALSHKTSQRGKAEAMAPERRSSADSLEKTRQPPIAILSILSPVIPYPSSLRHSLEHLAPHLATSFSLCRQYSHLETEAMGLHRRRPSNTGFGAVAPDGRPLEDSVALAQLNYTPSEEMSQRSITGSLTSPSDYSGGPSRSITASPMGTPIWEPGSFGLIVERRAAGTSPGQTGGDSYFNPRPRSGGVTNTETSSGVPSHRPVRVARESSSSGGRPHRRSGSLRYHIQEPAQVQREIGASDSVPGNSATTTAGEETSTQVHKQRPTSKDSAEVKGGADEQNSQQDVDDNSSRLSSGSRKHTRLHSYGGDFATTLQSLPPSTPLLSKPTTQSSTQPRPGSAPGAQVSMLPPTDRLKGLMLDLLPVHVFVALPLNGEIVWVNSRYLSYRGQTLADLVADPWGSLHPEDRDDYLRAWTQSLRTGEQFVYTVRIRRFDGAYRWHQARAVASRDKRGVIVQFIGSYMDIHDQKVAEMLALRQQEIEASEAKHRLLANLIPQIIFTATESDGITFANEQWLSYTGQSMESPLGLGFMDFVHPDDMAKCRLPADRISRAFLTGKNGLDTPSEFSSSTTIGQQPLSTNTPAPVAPTQIPNAMPALLARYSNSGNSSINDFPNADLNELVKKGIIKVTTDSNGRLSYTTELRLRSKSGAYRWHLIRCVQIADVGFGNGASSYFGSATDINDHKLLEAKLKEAMESKSRFLSNMSHEIRTPLIGISGMVSFLQDTTLNEEQRDYTNTIQTSANSLLMIINDILDLSKVDAGMMKLNFEWFHTRSLIEDVNELVSTMAIAKRLELNYIVEENVPSWVKGDKVRIRQVLLNVIGNAIKFTAEGEVFSRCRVFSDKTADLDEHQIMLEFSVIDTGRGFTKEEAELIFKPFSQIDGSSTRQHGGSGLGLVISRQLVELHGGTMKGSAVLGKGSTFTFTTRLGLPSSTDYPSVAGTPPMRPSMRGSVDDSAMHTIKPYLLHRTVEQPLTTSPNSEAETVSPVLVSSSGSDPSIRSARSQTTTRSSVSSVNVGLVHFSEAAKASGQDLSQMKLEMPSGKLSPQIAPTPDGTKFVSGLDQFRPPMYSILIICPQTHSREATTKHIETTLPKDVPHQITAMSSVSEAEALIGGHESVTFTHIVLNLGSAEEIIGVIDQIMTSSGGKPSVLVLSDSVHRQSVLKLASDPAHQQLIEEKRIIFVYKPVKPSRFAVIFDPARERDLSIDLNRSNAAQMVENQKQNYLDVEKRIGNKGYKVLLVEDNPVNQKVLVRYLKKVGIETEIAADGVEATEMVFTRPAKYYSLILCDLHMPRKDGYQACREIRQWEKERNHSQMPIIALSANVMSDVQEKCVAAGFNDYVTKPVDFVDLSTAMSKYF